MQNNKYKEQEKLTMALIGAGTWGETHAYLYDQDRRVDLTAICDLDIKKAQKVAAKFSVSGVYEDYQKMLKTHHFDAVAIVTPDFTHPEIVVACAEAGKDILLEKPLATTKKGIKDIIEIYNENDIRMMVDFHNRWNPPFAKAKEKIENNEIGVPVSSYFRLNDIKWVATDLLPWAEKSSILWFLGSHTIDTLNWLFEDNVKRVYSVSHKGVLVDEGVDTTDIYQTTLEFEKGAIATIENGWITPNNHPNVNDIKFNMTGSEGIINIDPTNNRLIEMYNQQEHENPDILVNHFIHGKAEGFAYKSILHFVENLLSGKEFLVSVKDAVKTSLIILAILESDQKKKPVEVDYTLLESLE
ncbi:MAG: Gfo/Idh/MocA family protein [bacterium]